MKLSAEQKVMVPVVMTFKREKRLACMMPLVLAEKAKPGDIIGHEDGTPDDILESITIFNGDNG